MKPLVSLAWKEWREARPYLWIGLGLFLALPGIGAVEQWVARPGHTAELLASPWVYALGGVLAVMVGVGVTSPDLRPRVADFWRSRPVAVGPWLAVKFAVALGVVLVACTVPLLVELQVNHHVDRDVGAYAAYLPFFWAAAFGVAFLAGCVVDRPAHAAVLGLAGLLLIYVVPVLVPPLAWLNVNEVGANGWTRSAYHDHRWESVRSSAGPAVFACGMIAVAITAAGLATVAVRCGWRIESGRRLLFGAVGGVFLLLLATVGFQLGSNLPIVHVATLPADERVEAIQMNGTEGYASVRTGLDRPMQGQDWCRSLHVGPGGIEVGPRLRWDDDRAVELAHSVDPIGRPIYAYDVIEEGEPGGATETATLCVSRWNVDGPIRKIPLWTYDSAQHREMWSSVYRWSNRVFVLRPGRRVTFDVSRPDDPRRIADEPYHWAGKSSGWPQADIATAEVPLVDLPGVPAADRLRLSLGRWNFDGRTYCGWGTDSTLNVYRLTRLTDRSATFERIGTYQRSLLERTVAREGWRADIAGDLVFVHTVGRYAAMNGLVTVIDTAGPGPLRNVGHFAVPGAAAAAPLADGRMVVGGENQLWLVDAPRR